MKLKNPLSFLPLLLLMCQACGDTQKPPTGATITIMESCKPEEILPMMAYIDLISDTANMARELKFKSEVLNLKHDSLNIQVSEYLMDHMENSLFKLLHPHITTPRNSMSRPHPPAATGIYEESAYLGTSLYTDTTAVTKILSASGMIKPGTIYQWIPYDATEDLFIHSDWDSSAKYAGLTATVPESKTLMLGPEDIQDIKRLDYRPSRFWQWIDKLKGFDRYKIQVTFSPSCRDKIRAAYPDSAVLLLKCHYLGHDVYCSGTASRMEDGASFGSNR